MAKSVVLLSVDSLRFDHFGPDHFPRCWEQFEADFVRFQRTISIGVATPFAIPAFVTGERPSPDGTIDTDRSVAHEFDQARALTNNPHCGPHRGYNSGFESFSTGARSSARFVDETIDQAIEWAGSPGLSWIHCMEPHFPFDVPNDVNDRFVDGTATVGDLDRIREAYGEAIRSLDRELSRFLRAIELEECMVIFVSDHGEAFGESGVFNHDWDAPPIDVLVHVPLAVSVPGFGGGVADNLVETTQVADAIRQQSIKPLLIPAQEVKSHSNEWTRIDTACRTQYIDKSAYSVEMLDRDHSVGEKIVSRLKNLGYR